jgi:hypothetical protein
LIKLGTVAERFNADVATHLFYFFLFHSATARPEPSFIYLITWFGHMTGHDGVRPGAAPRCLVECVIT